MLPEVSHAVAGQAEVWVDGGFMRGTDVVKAIALGAKTVGLGRLACLGLAAAGVPGLVRTLELLEDEVRICLGLLGVTSLRRAHAAAPRARLGRARTRHLQRLSAAIDRVSSAPGGQDMRTLALALAVAAGAATAAPADCKLVRIEEWTVRFERNLPVIDGEINGSKVTILIDSTAERSFITRSAATRLALTRYDASAQGMYAIPRDRPVEAVRIDELKIGPAKRRDWGVLLAASQDFGTDVSLVLGEDLLSATDIEFDLASRAVRLFEPRDCQGVSLAYWAKGAAAEAALEPGGRTMFTVSVNGRPMHAMFDTGTTVSALTMPEAARFGLTPQSPGVVTAGCSIGIGRKPVDYWSGPFESFAIGNETIRNPALRFGEIFKSAAPLAELPQMVLGMDFLRTHRVYVARSQKKLYFTYTGGTVFPADAAKGCQDLR